MKQIIEPSKITTAQKKSDPCQTKNKVVFSSKFSEPEPQATISNFQILKELKADKNIKNPRAYYNWLKRNTQALADYTAKLQQKKKMEENKKLQKLENDEYLKKLQKSAQEKKARIDAGITLFDELKKDKNKSYNYYKAMPFTITSKQLKKYFNFK